MLFTSFLLNPPPDGVSISEGLVDIPERKVTYMIVHIANTIYLDQCKVIGHLETVKCIQHAASPMEMSRKRHCARHNQGH